MGLDFDHELFTARQNDQIAVIRFKKNLIRQLTDLNLKEGLFKYLHAVSNDKVIKVMVCFGNPEKIKCEEIITFFNELSASAIGIDQISRVYNAINQLVLLIREMDKIVVHADSGEVLSLFLNISLACDYRIIGDKTVFQYPLLEFGLIPKGGGIFFLAQKLGTSKTMDLLMSGKDIDAREALELGLVDKVVPSKDIEKAAQEAAEKIASKPMPFISGVKRLMHYAAKDLESFLDYENAQLLECIKSGCFRQGSDQCYPK
jgi:2-(1,2-epoxy-1,2-dihydrophenyl)acetyl-CoA isomerase